MPHGFMIACGSADEADGGKEKVNNGTDPELEVYHVYGRTAGQELSWGQQSAWNDEWTKKGIWKGADKLGYNGVGSGKVVLWGSGKYDSKQDVVSQKDKANK